MPPSHSRCIEAAGLCCTSETLGKLVGGPFPCPLPLPPPPRGLDVVVLVFLLEAGSSRSRQGWEVRVLSPDLTDVHLATRYMPRFAPSSFAMAPGQKWADWGSRRFDSILQGSIYLVSIPIIPSQSGLWATVQYAQR